MSTKERSYIPPIDVEYDPTTEGVDTIVWSLGTPEHPWRNIYLNDPSISEEGYIDVYAALSNVASVPNDDTRKPGSFITCDGGTPNLLIWQPLDDAAKQYISGETLQYILNKDNVAVASAIKDQNGDVIDLTYFRKDDFTASNIVNTISLMPVKRATADKNGNDISTYYVPMDVYLETVSQKANDADLHRVAKSGQYTDLDGLPTIPDIAFIQQYVADQLKGYTKNSGYSREDGDTGLLNVISGNGLKMVHTYAPTTGVITDSRVALDKASIVTETSPGGETTTVYNPGSVSVKRGFGLSFDDDTALISLDKASESTYGTVKVTPGNGLNYVNGTLIMSKATASQYGTVKIGTADTLSGAFSAIPADGQLYLWTGTLNEIRDTWIVRKVSYVNSVHNTANTYGTAYSTYDPRLELHTNDNGSTWYAPYSTWHA